MRSTVLRRYTSTEALYSKDCKDKIARQATLCGRQQPVRVHGCCASTVRRSPFVFPRDGDTLGSLQKRKGQPVLAGRGNKLGRDASHNNPDLLR